MKPGHLLIFPLSAALGGILSVACRTTAPFGASQRVDLSGDIIAGWSKSSRLTAAALIEQYGPPDAIASDGLGWKNKGRWRKIIVRDQTELRVLEREGAGMLEQTVTYRMPEDKRPELRAFTDEVRVSADGTALTASADEEALNFLSLNLAVAIGRGDVDAAGARDSYKRAVDLSRAGKSSPLMRELLFPPIP
jgi:hypothetical protein